MVEFKELQKELKDHFTKLKDYIVFGVPRGYGSFRPKSNEGRGPAIAKEIDKFSDAFLGNEDDVAYFLDPNRYKDAIPKPVVKCSDAHKSDMIGCGFTWIKSDTTFEGLKQIIYEPEERVKIQSEYPETWKNIYTLSSVRIDKSYINKELQIDEQDISLNRNLITVTGGKGSGKTAFLDLIANCFEDRCSRDGINKDDNSFVQRIEDQKQDLGIKLEFIGDNIESFSKKLTEAKLIKGSKIAYLPQGKLKEYSGDSHKLADKIEEVIFGNKDISKRGYKQIFDKLKNEINEIVKKVDDVNKDIYDLEEETKKDIISKIDSQKGIAEGLLRNSEDELKIFTRNLGEGIREKIEKIEEEAKSLQVKDTKISRIGTNLKKFKQDVEEFLNNTNKTVNALNLDLSGISIKSKIPIFDFSIQIDTIDNALKFIENETTKLGSQIKCKSNQIGKFSDNEKIHVKMVKEIENIKNQIQFLENELEQLNDKKDKIRSLACDREGYYYQLLRKYHDLKLHYDQVIAEFSEGNSEIMSGIRFESSICFDEDDFLDLGSDILDLRRINVDEIKEITDNLQAVIHEENCEDMITKLKQFMAKVCNKKDFLISRRTNYDFYRWLFGNYLSLNTQIFFKGISMDKLSMGQKGTVLLKLFLAEGDYPLIMDQPEENLDNDYIYNELKDAFKQAKKKRQIIIATNNANLIVNTDAEQIIIAEFENNKISYKSGSLSDFR